jgi:hypothetical protein
MHDIAVKVNEIVLFLLLLSLTMHHHRASPPSSSYSQRAVTLGFIPQDHSQLRAQVPGIGEVLYEVHTYQTVTNWSFVGQDLIERTGPI